MKRNPSIDIARGIGILLVVLGHSWFADTQAHPEFRESLSTFRMPFFFFVSGLFLSLSANPPTFVRTRADALLKPYFVVLLAVWAIYAAKDVVTGEASGTEILHKLGAIFYGTGPILSIAPLWFLPLLFLSSLGAYFIVRALPPTLPSRALWLLGGALALLILWVPMIDHFWGLDAAPGVKATPGPDALPGLPWSIDILPISLAFMLAGYALRERVFALDWNPVGFLAAAAVLIGLRLTFDQSMDLNLRRYDGFIFVTIQAAAGILMLLYLSTALTRFTLARSALIYVGQGALFLLLFHYHIQRRIFFQLNEMLPSPYLAAAIAFAAAIALPLLMWEAAKRSRILSALLLPTRRARQPRGTEVLA